MSAAALPFMLQWVQDTMQVYRSFFGLCIIEAFGSLSLEFSGISCRALLSAGHICGRPCCQTGSDQACRSHPEVNRSMTFSLPYASLLVRFLVISELLVFRHSSVCVYVKHK